ncbi:hypothetical protein C8Q75DRAFT_784478 [Abortiporus biennis]|nr:hypothetical protein C8Q75DRAFT_784478 [Abortiporus biennis]
MLTRFTPLASRRSTSSLPQSLSLSNKMSSQETESLDNSVTLLKETRFITQYIESLYIEGGCPFRDNYCLLPKITTMTLNWVHFQQAWHSGDISKIDSEGDWVHLPATMNPSKYGNQISVQIYNAGFYKDSCYSVMQFLLLFTNLRSLSMIDLSIDAHWTHTTVQGGEESMEMIRDTLGADKSSETDSDDGFKLLPSNLQIICYLTVKRTSLTTGFLDFLWREGVEYLEIVALGRLIEASQSILLHISLDAEFGIDYTEEKDHKLLENFSIFYLEGCIYLQVFKIEINVNRHQTNGDSAIAILSSLPKSSNLQEIKLNLRFRKSEFRKCSPRNYVDWKRLDKILCSFDRLKKINVLLRERLSDDMYILYPTIYINIVNEGLLRAIEKGLVHFTF